jgi:hypothetical protein
MKLAAKGGGGGSGDLLITCANVMMGKKNVISAVVVLFTRHDRSFFASIEKYSSRTASSFLS